jgi:hypothetical protein
MTNRIEQILDLARWAPSGDNTQPWRFEIVSEDRMLVHGFDTRDHCVYDLTGHPSQIALGGLLETIRIAASHFGFRADIQRLASPETRPTFDIHLVHDPAVAPSALQPCIKARAVQRRPMKSRRLTITQKQALEASLGKRYTVVWFEGWRRRLSVARLLFRSARIRLITPEAFEVHRNVIEWNARFSTDKVPDRAIGLDPLTLRLMRWAMRDWHRIEFLNTYLAGTIGPRIQLDFVPGMACAAHFLIVYSAPPAGIDDYVAGGAAVQRFWLTATRLGLYLQPEMTPLIFAGYARERRQFSQIPEALELAEYVRLTFDELVGGHVAQRALFMGRIGAGPAPAARSTRLPVDRLMYPANAE